MRRKVNLRNSDTTKVETAKAANFHEKIAANRGDTWRKNTVLGKLEASANPTAIRLTRLNKRLLQKVVANELGLTTGTYGEIECGRRYVERERAVQIARYYGQKENRLFKKMKSRKYLAIKA